MVDSERASDALREERLNLTSLEDRQAQAAIALTVAQTTAARTAKIITTANDNAKPATNAQALRLESAQLDLALSESQTAKHEVEASRLKVEIARLDVEASKLGLIELRTVP
jgi:hypothetical protein